MNSNHFLLLLALLHLLHQGIAAPFTVSFNTHYLKADRFEIDTSQSFNNNATSNWNPLTFVISYSTQFPNANSTSVVLATDQMNILQSDGKIQFSGKMATQTLTQFTFNLESTLTAFIKSLGFRYTVITNEYSEASSNMKVRSYFFNVGLNISTVASAIGYENSTLSLMPSSNPVIIPFISGLNLQKTTESNIFNLEIKTQIESSAIKFIITSSSATSTLVNSISIYLLIYSPEYYNRDQYAAFSFESLSGNNPVTHTHSNNVYQPNIMVGLSGFSFSTAIYNDFEINFSSPNQLQLSSTITNSVLKGHFVSMKTYFCNVLFSTYDQPTNSCVLHCPERTFPDETTTTCGACPYECYTCDSSGKCLSCNQTTDFRILQNNRCVPISGYYQSYTTIAGQCQSPCTQCISLSSCTSCLPGYNVESGACVYSCPLRNYYNSVSCVSCPYDCYTCNSSVNCLSCSSSSDHRKLKNNRCVPMQGYYQTYVTVAGKCPTGCSSCSSSSYCTACQSGYTLSSWQCVVACSPRMYYNSYSCVSCPYDCLTCNTYGNCLSCDSANDHRIYSNGRCIPQSGYYQSYWAVASKCPEGCSSCLSDTYCQNCDSNYILSQNSCLLTAWRQQSGGSQSTQSTPITIIALGAAGGVIFLVILVIIIRKIYRKYSDRGGIYPIHRKTSEDISSQIILHHGWFDGNWQELKDECQITYENLTFCPYVKTCCTHCFYIKAFVTWAKKSPVCACCRRDLRGQTHKVFCPSGCRRYRQATTEEIIQTQIAGRTVEENTYPECKNV